jgi:hypothetical protein
MTNITTKLESQPAAETAVHLFDTWFDPIETGLRDRVAESEPLRTVNPNEAGQRSDDYGQLLKAS